MDAGNSPTMAKNIFRIALILSLVIIYPNIGDVLWKLFSPPGSMHHMELPDTVYFYFVYRYFFFLVLTWSLIRFNIRNGHRNLNSRMWLSFGIAASAYGLYVFIGSYVSFYVRFEAFTKMVILQFIIAWLVPVLVGYIYTLINSNQKQQQEMEVLRAENLQSRVDALTNQINPHFFFNSLNGLTALVSANRNMETVEYVDKLSDIFRYILQSDKKGIVTLDDELQFLDAYRYLIEIRYSGKISFMIDVGGCQRCLQLPVLSLLPLIENIIKHNIIDSDHHMKVSILLRDEHLVVMNPMFSKYQQEASHGIGLSNLAARYKLLMGTTIRIVEENDTFCVLLPLKKACEEES